MGKPSTIDRLPDDILERLHELLRDPRVTQLEATAKINKILEADGHQDRVTKSAVNRYDLKMREAGEKLRQSREMAKMWIGQLGAAPQGQVGHLINEILRTLVFELSLKLQNEELTPESMPGVISQLKGLSLAVQRLESSSTMNVKREAEIKKQERERLKDETMKAVDAAGAGGRMTADMLKEEIMKVYGA